MELNLYVSLLRTEKKSNIYNIENFNSDSPKIKPEMQNNNRELAKKDQDVNDIVLSDPDPVTEVDNRKALTPPPLPPKRSPAFEKTLSPQLKAFDKDSKPWNSLACQTSPVLSEIAHEIAETPPDGKQTNQKTNARRKMKKLVRMMVRLKEGREEKGRIKAGEMEMDGVREDDIDLTQVCFTLLTSQKHITLILKLLF